MENMSNVIMLYSPFPSNLIFFSQLQASPVPLPKRFELDT